jgi:phosphogluconate 2-dehydrogenase
MDRLKIVVWDNIGNTLLGMRSWEAWGSHVQERLTIEDHAARERVVTVSDVLGDQPYDLVWLYDPVKSQRGFSSLFTEMGARLVDTNEPGAIAREVADADFFILHKETLPPQALKGATKLKLIQHLGLDYRGVPMAEAAELGVPVAATPLVNYSAVAEHVWAMILGDLKRTADQRDYMTSRGYLKEWGAYHPGVQIVSDLTLGLLGMGEIARPVAAVAKAFNMRVVYWDIQRFPKLEASLGIEFVEWDEVFRQSDVLSVHLALNEQTEGIIGANEFAEMRPTALFVNSARGKLVDQDALIHALDNWEIRAAALEVFAEEPLPADSRLHEFHEAPEHRVILTPHSAAQGPWTWVRDSQELWFNIRRVLDGEPIKHAVS